MQFVVPLVFHLQVTSFFLSPPFLLILIGYLANLKNPNVGKKYFRGKFSIDKFDAAARER
jgi:hypothetical protein